MWTRPCVDVSMHKGPDGPLNSLVSQPFPYFGVSALGSQRHTVCLLTAVRCHGPMGGEQYGGTEDSGATQVSDHWAGLRWAMWLVG